MSFVRNAWYHGAWSTQVGTKPLHRRICGEDIAFFRDAEQRVRAIGAACPHRGANLGGGRVVDGALECPFHGWRFDGAGHCVRVPSQPSSEKIPPAARVASYPVVEQQGVIWIWPVRGAEPFESPPRFRILEETDQLMQHEADLLESQFVNVVENAFDESHLYFLHRRTIGVRTPLVPRQIVERESDGRGVECRWDPESPWGQELLDGYDDPRGFVGRYIHSYTGNTHHTERRWHYRMGGIVHYDEPHERGFVGVLGAATPMDEQHTWFATALSHPIVKSRTPNSLIRWWGRELNAEDRTGTVGLLSGAGALERPVSVLADHGANQFRRMEAEWRRREQSDAPVRPVPAAVASAQSGAST